ncbi:MAG: CPBP family intramembrane glutamic endopeptidase [Myxococcota bacterium]|nr:CPBP family intramembrane glutamic endopeptidase [Myxococcota bacterium]
MGFKLGNMRYLGFATMTAIIAAIATWNWMSVDIFLHGHSPQAPFLGLGIGKKAIVMALLYGVVQTGFTEEVFFRGLIGGAVMRRFGLWRGNVLQSLIFLGPHLFLLVVMPEQWKILPVIFAGALWGGWLLHKSGSFVGPWLIHAAVNVTTCLLAAASMTGK